MFRSLPLVALILFSASAAFVESAVQSGNHLDTYAAIEALVPSDRHPRALNTDDLHQLNINTPFPLVSPVGDFDKDGVIREIAISGVFDLQPKGGEKYFLLVAARGINSHRYKRLYWEVSAQPIFIHLPGTTGLGDPKDQAFSTSLCIDCIEGLDFYWDRKKSSFVTKRWENRRSAPMPPEETEDVVSPGEADKALKIVGGLKDVNNYIAALKERSGNLSVKIIPLAGAKKACRYKVQIGESNGGGVIIFDDIVVDTGKMKVIKRQRKNKVRGHAGIA